MILILRFAFLTLYIEELYLTVFKNKRDKYIWIFIAFVFGYFGYAIYLVFKRRLIVKRTFNPDFTKCEYYKQ